MFIIKSEEGYWNNEIGCLFTGSLAKKQRFFGKRVSEHMEKSIGKRKKNGGIVMKIVNLTPHDIVITDGPTFPPSGTVARVSVQQVEVGDINGISVKAQTFGDIVDLPPPQDDTVFIVSAMVLNAAKEAGRNDCVAPDTSNAVRDDAGHIVSVPGFVK